MNKSVWMVYAAMGFELGGLVVIMIYFGSWIDQKMGWSGLGIIGGAVFALISWIYHLFIFTKNIEKIKNKK